MVKTQIHESTRLQEELIRDIHARTGQRVRNLRVEILRDTVVLRGQTDSWYVKQLAQHTVFVLLPRVGVRNAITVSDAA